MPSCSSGGGKTYGLDPEIVKSSSTSTRSSLNSLSPSSTLSESSNGPPTICTRKPRTQRKRPNQKYNEAAALLSTAYPNIFSSNNSIGSLKFAAAHENYLDDSLDLLLPFRVVDKSEFLLHHDDEPIIFQEIEKPIPQTWPKLSPSFSEIQSTPMDLFQEDFDAESILDEEIEEGIIDTIMGDFCVSNDNEISTMSNVNDGYWCGEPSGFGTGFGGRVDLGFGFGFGQVRGVSGALRNVNEGKNNNWWDFPTVDVLEISPKFRTCTSSNSPAKKKKKKEEKLTASPPLESKCSELPQEDPCPTLNPTPQPKLELLLKLNYDGVLDAWSGHGSPFSDETLQDTHGNDIYARLAQIDLFSEAGGVREARVLRYKEKRRTRLFSKKIRYEVRKVNADQRPRNKGRFVRRSNSGSNSRDEKKRMKK